MKLQLFKSEEDALVDLELQEGIYYPSMISWKQKHKTLSLAFATWNQPLRSCIVQPEQGLSTSKGFSTKVIKYKYEHNQSHRFTEFGDRRANGAALFPWIESTAHIGF